MAGVLGEDVLKRIKALRKKLSQIEKLKARGGQYTEEEATKIKSETKILEEIQALEKGEEATPFDEAAVQEPPPPEAKPEPEDGGEAEVSGGKEPDLAPAEAEKRIRGLKKKLVQIQKLKERGGGFSKEESEKVGSEPSLLAECTELEIKLLEPEARKTARSLQKKLDQISKLRAKGGLTPQEREKVGKEGSLKKELSELLAARVPVKEPAAQTGEQSPVPDAKAAPKAAQQAVPQEQAPVAEVKPQPPQPQPAQHKPAPRSTPQTEQAPMSTYMGPPPSMTATQGVAPVEDEAHVEDDAHVAAALAQAFAQEELMEEEGFLESRASTRKRAIQAKAQARAEAARLQQEQLEAERAQREQEAAALAERARQEQDRRQEERQLAAQRAQQGEQERQAALAAAATEAEEEEEAEEAEEAAEEEKETGPLEEEETQVAEVAEPALEVAGEPAPDVAVPQAVLEPEAAPGAALDAAPAPEKPAPEKRLRALKKKVTQIEKLKQRGGEYTPEESEKLASEDSVLAEIAALENGDSWPPVVKAAPEPAPVVQQQEEEVLPVEVAAQAPPPAAPPLEVSSMDPVDAQKRLKALKKKLGQIEKLKERSGPFSPEETAKIASQPHVLADIKKLEEYLA